MLAASLQIHMGCRFFKTGTCVQGLAPSLHRRKAGLSGTRCLKPYLLRLFLSLPLLHRGEREPFFEQKNRAEVREFCGYLIGQRNRSFLTKEMQAQSASPSPLHRESSGAGRGGKRRNSHHSAVFGKAGNGTAVGISELVRDGRLELPA